MPTVTINAGVNHQTFRGWQLSGEIGQTDYPVSAQNWKAAAVQAAVDMGWNRVRVGSHAGIENTTDYFQLWIDANSDIPHAARNTWAANRAVPVNDNADPNDLNAAGFQFGQINWQMSQVIVPMKAALAARGESLFIVHTYVHFSPNNRLHIDTPAEYGEYMLAVWNHYQATYGYVPNALEIFLEPDNSADPITAAELAAIIVAARDRLVGAGYAKPYIIAPSTTSGPAAEDYYTDIKTANATAASYIDEIGYHRYVDIDNTALGQLRAVAEADGKNTGMTEFEFGDVFDLFNDLNTGKVSCWEKYSISYPDATNTHFDIGSSPGYAITIREVSKYIQHYTKYIRYGAVMKGVTNSDGSCQGIVFENTNGTYVAVIKATGALTCDVVGLPPGTYGRRRTQGDGVNAPSSYDSDLGNATVTTTEDVTVTFTAAGFATIYDLEYLDQPPQTSSPRAKRLHMFG